MKLSDGEKLIAFMLADMMKAQGIRSELDPDFIMSAIAGDDLWAIRWKYDSLFHEEGPSDEIVKETADIMTMCRVVETSIDQLEDDARASLHESEQRVFIGFDANEEPHYGVATMLVEELNRFSEWRDRPLNSHSTTLARYRRQKNVFDRLDWSHDGLLSLAEVKAVLEA